VRLLESTVYATNITEAAWTAVSLGSIDLGIGYNYYAWRIGVVGANDGDQYAIDNVGVETATGYRFIPVANHSFTDASNFEFRNNSDNIAVAEADIGQWVSRESGADSSMDIADITGAAFNGDNIYAQDGDSSMLFQAKSQRALVQVVDVRAFNIAGNKLTLGAIFSARDSNPAKSAVLKMRGFNSFTGLTVDLGGDWSFTGGTFIHDYGTTTVEQNEMLGQSCMKTLSGNSPLDFDYLAIIVGGAQSTDHNLNSDWVAVDNLKLFLPPAGGSVMLVQ
jgi:hypothetical protein